MKTPWTQEFGQMLRCPESLQELTPMDAAAFDNLQDAIIDGRALTTQGQPILEALEGAMVREDHTIAYPIRAGILNMLLTDRIDLTSLATASAEEE